MKKLLIGVGSLTVIAAMAIAVPAMRGIAIESHTAAGRSERQPQDCDTKAGELTGAVTELQSGITAVPPKLDGAAPLVNQLLKQVTGLIDLGCLPAPELPAAQQASKERQTTRPSFPPMPSFPPLPSGLPVPSVSALPLAANELPSVPVCTDLTADLLNAAARVLAALLSTGAPDLPGAASALADLLDTLTKLTDEANKCVPAQPSAAVKR